MERAGEILTHLPLRIQNLFGTPPTQRGKDFFQKIWYKNMVTWREIYQPVQNFYNGPCAAVDVDVTKNIEEINSLIEAVMEGTQSD